MYIYIYIYVERVLCNYNEIPMKTFHWYFMGSLLINTCQNDISLAFANFIAFSWI